MNIEEFNLPAREEVLKMNKDNLHKLAFQMLGTKNVKGESIEDLRKEVLIQYDLISKIQPKRKNLGFSLN